MGRMSASTAYCRKRAMPWEVTLVLCIAIKCGDHNRCR